MEATGSPATAIPLRVLVAGGAGLIGSRACAELLRRGHDVTCLDDLSTGNLDNIAVHERDPRFSFIRASVTQAPLLSVDLILHLASPSSALHQEELPIETMLANSAGTHRLLALARDTGARFVYASGAAVYGDAPGLPQVETCSGSVDVAGPRACYAEAARFGEALTFAYGRAHGVSTAVVRVFNTYGPGMSIDDGRVVPAFAAAALEGRALPVFGDGLQTRSFCYVDDAVEGLLLVALDPAAAGMAVNLGSPHEISVLELAHAVSRAANAPLRIEHLCERGGDVRRRRPDVGRMRARYDWEPRVPLTEGLRRTVTQLREQMRRRAEAA